MRRSVLFFGLSDVFNHPLRNYQRFPTVRCDRGLVYDERYGNETALDVYYTDSDAELRPVLVNVHGGGFVRGDKRFRSGFARYFAARGWVVVNINYRLAPGTTYPAAIEDTIHALNFIRSLADRYRFDLDRLVLTGDSAGGYYAAMATAAIYSSDLRARLGLPAYQGDGIRALMTFCAPFDMLKCFLVPSPLDVSLDVANCVFGTRLKTPRKGDDFPFADEDVSVLPNVNSDWCECYLEAAEKDSFCGGQVDGMADALAACGVKYTVKIASGKHDRHCTHLFPFLKDSRAVMRDAAAFLEGIRAEGGKQ